MKTYLYTGILLSLLVLCLLICSIGATVVNSEPLFLLLSIPCLISLYYLHKFRFRIPVNFTIILELAYGGILWGFFQFYLQNKDYYFDHDILSSLFAGLLILILATEWIRRWQHKIKRPKYEKYFYIPAMFFMLLFAIYYVNSLLSSY